MQKRIAIIGISGLVIAMGSTVAIAAVDQAATTPVYSSPVLCVNEHTGAVNAYGYGKCPAYPASVLVMMPVAVVTPSPSASPSSGNTVTIIKPPKQSSAQGVSGIDLPVQATDSAANQVLTFKMSGAPDGLTIDSSTGVITGMIDDTDPAETYAVTVTAVDTTGASDSVTFDWTVTSS
jgi:Putative Ig domain